MTLWYLPNICSRISQACLCNSASKSIRLSFNIAMMSRWFRVIRTSSSNGKSHSKRTIKVCTSLRTLVTLSNPIIQPMSWSCTASCKGRVLVRLSIRGTDMTTLSWSQTLRFQTGSSGFLSNSSHSSIIRPVVGVLIVQTPHLCLQDLLPTSACQLLHFTYFSLLISRPVVGASTCPNTSLVSPGLTPNLSLSRYSQASQKHVISGNQLTSHSLQMTLQPTCPQEVKQKHTSPESRLLKLFDALCFTTAMHQPSDHCKSLVQAQHRSRENPGAQYKRSQLHLRRCP